MLAHGNMPSAWKKHPDLVVDKVLKRAEISKIARKLQGRLQLAQFKTRHGWEDLTLDTIEPKVEEQIRRKRQAEVPGGDTGSASSSDHSQSVAMVRNLMSSPLKASVYSDGTGSSNGSTGHRKRSYLVSFEEPLSSPVKRFRASPTPRRNKTFPATNPNWRTGGVATGAGAGTGSSHYHQLTQSSPIKPRRHQHFTTTAGPDVSLFQASRSASAKDLTSAASATATAAMTTNFAAPHDDSDDDGLLPSFHVNNSASIARSSPPRTPLVRSKNLLGPKQGGDKGLAQVAKPEEQASGLGAGLLLYLAQSPSPAVPGNKPSTAMEPPSTPPPRNLALPSSMMTTPGGGNLFPTTPGQGSLDFSEFLKFTPSPAPRTFKTPGALSTARTPLTGVSRQPLTFD